MGYAAIRERDTGGKFVVPTIPSGFDVKEYRKKRYQSQREIIKERALKWGRNNKKKRKLIKDRWREKNRERTNFLTRLYHYRKKSAGGILYFEQVMTLYGKDCHYCGKPKSNTVDHVVPLSRGGTNEITNLVPACGRCNSRKGNKLISEWKIWS